MMGIDVNRTISVTFLLAGALAGAAGIIYLLQFNMRYDTGFELGLIAFTAAVLGGIGNLTGAVARRAADRIHPGVQRGPRLVRPGQRLDALDGVRDPHPRSRLPSRRPPRGTDTGGRMTDVGDTCALGRRQPQHGRGRGAARARGHLSPDRRLARVAARDRRLHAEDGLDGRDDRRSRRWRSASTWSSATPGLLDLGYVAFYAVGAYTAGWFASQQFDQVVDQRRRGRVSPTGFPGSTSRCGSCSRWQAS